MLVTFSESRSNRIRHHAGLRPELYPLMRHAETNFGSAATVGQFAIPVGCVGRSATHHGRRRFRIGVLRSAPHTLLYVVKLASRDAAARIGCLGRLVLEPSSAGLLRGSPARHAKNQCTAAEDKNRTQKVRQRGRLTQQRNAERRTKDACQRRQALTGPQH